MSINALVTGKLHTKPESRVGGSGKPYTRAAVIAHDGETDGFVSVIAFGHVADQLAALDKGEAVSVSGRAQVKTWDKNGEMRAGLSVVADCILTMHHVRRKRQAMAAANGDDSSGDQHSTAGER